MKSILVVDDEFDLTSTLRAILEGEGYHVETCADGREALERLREAKPDLMLMDVMLPLLLLPVALPAVIGSSSGAAP